MTAEKLITPREFVALVKQMRVAQREYFKSRDKDVLQNCKQLEAQVDGAMARFEAAKRRR